MNNLATMGLSPREQEVVETLVGSGRTSTKELAEEMGITPSTVKHHFSSIFDKTGTDNKTQLVLLITRQASLF